MKRIVFASLIFGALFMGALSPPAVLPELLKGRTPSELGLYLLLNGERTRAIQSDGGAELLFVNDAGLSAPLIVPGGGVIYIECPTTAAHICGPLADGTWDGGCNTTVGDPNYGSQIPIAGFRWISLRDSTTTIKAVPASGSANVSCPVYRMR